MNLLKPGIKSTIQIIIFIIFFSTLQAKSLDKFEKGADISNYFSGILLLDNNQYNESYRFLKKLDGSFSILILDLNNDKIFAVKDRHGSSVLFYYNKRNLLLIFTKIKFMKENLIVQLFPNWDLIKIYIFKNYINGSRSFPTS